MATSSIRLVTLFNRYYVGDATQEETEELMRVINASKNDDHLAELLRTAWENSNSGEAHFSAAESDRILSSILQSVSNEVEEAEDHVETQRYFGWWKFAAAAVVLLVGFAAFFKFQKSGNDHPVAVIKSEITDIPPGGNRALLTLSDGSTIMLDSAKNGLLTKQGSAEITKTDDGHLVYKLMNGAKNIADNQMNMLSTPKGGQYQLTLPDGSKVWLNASSSIRFPAVFSDNERIVEITGEAYFEVAKNKKRPFRVFFSGSEVEVLGTVFNVMAYQDEQSTKTTLVEGAVALKNGGRKKRLKPGQQGSVFSSGEIVMTAVDMEAAIAWKKGLFYFRDAGIEEVMRQASRWYDIDVSYTGKIPVRQFTGKVARNVNISELLNMLRYVGVNCRVENKKIIVST